MAAPDLTSMTPLVINATNLPCLSISYDPGIGGTEIRHSGLDFASNYIRGTGNPVITCTAPLKAAYDLIGTKSLAVTTLEMHLATYSAGVKQAGTVKYDLATSATGIATITGLGQGPGGIITADIQIVLLSSDGTTHPLTEETAVAIPALAAEPALHILGPIAIDAGARISGVTSFSASLGNSILSSIFDGDTYPRTANYRGGSRSINLGHQSPKSVIAALGHDGTTPTTSAIVYLRSVGATYVTTGSTGASITAAACSVHPTTIGQSPGAHDTTGILINAIDGASNGTDPLTFGFAATIPAA